MVRFNDMKRVFVLLSVRLSAYKLFAFTAAKERAASHPDNLKPHRTRNRISVGRLKGPGISHISISHEDIFYTWKLCAPSYWRTQLSPVRC